MPDVSRHAIKRIRERLGINKSAAEREGIKSLEAPRIADFGGRFRRFLDHQRIYHDPRSDFRVTDAGIFVWVNDVLVTVIPLPKAHKASARRQIEKLKRHPR